MTAQQQEDDNAVSTPAGSLNYGPPIPDVKFEEDVELERYKGDVRRTAKRRDNEDSYVPFERLDFATWIDNDEDEPEWSIENLHVRGGNTAIIAQWGAGKTTMVQNLVVGYLDGVPLFGKHAFRDLGGGCVGLLDMELGPAMLKMEYRKVNIKNRDRFKPAPMQGQNIDFTSNEAARADLISWIKVENIKVLILDPLHGLYPGDQNDNSEMTRWTKGWDAIKAESGVEDLFIAAHTSKAKVDDGDEGTLGAVRFDGWRSHGIVLTKVGTDRFVRFDKRAITPEWQKTYGLKFDPATNLYSYDFNMSKSSSKSTSAMAPNYQAILTCISNNPGINASGIELKTGIGNHARIKGVKDLISQGLIMTLRQEREVLHYEAGDPAFETKYRGLEMAGLLRPEDVGKCSWMDNQSTDA